MAAVVCQCGRSRIGAFSPASGAPPSWGATLSASGSIDPSSRKFVAPIEPTDFAPGVMAGAPSANTVQISAESVQDLRLHCAFSNPVRTAVGPCRLPWQARHPELDLSEFSAEFVVSGGD